VTEVACPFCGGTLSESFRDSPGPLGPGVRLTRAALFAFGAGTLAVAPGCSGAETSVTPFYGAAMIEDAGGDGGFQGEPLYGAPPAHVDAGSDGGGAGADGGPGSEGGTIGPVYGAPPSGDSGIH
jgi:hypothetical protein